MSPDARQSEECGAHHSFVMINVRLSFIPNNQGIFSVNETRKFWSKSFSR